MRLRGLGPLLILITCGSFSAGWPSENECDEILGPPTHASEAERYRYFWVERFMRVHFENVRASVATGPHQFLPGGLPADFQDLYNEVWRLVTNPIRFFALLQDFEAAVVERAGGDREDRAALRAAFLPELREWETRYGFGEPVEVTTYLTQSEHMRLLRERRPIVDTYYIGKERLVHTQRLQLVLVCYHLEKKKKVHASRERIRAFMSELGNGEGLANLDWSETGLAETDLSLERDGRAYPDPFGYLLNLSHLGEQHKLVTGDFRTPEFLASLKPMVPGLVGWE